MRCCVQRVTKAGVTVDAQTVGEIGGGLCVLVGFTHTDTEKDIDYMVKKLVNLRIFDDADGKMNLSALDIGAQMLLISQFTLYGDTRGGRRPSYTASMKYDEAEKLYDRFVEKMRECGLMVACGVYGAEMSVEIHNSGPVTILVDSELTF